MARDHSCYRGIRQNRRCVLAVTLALTMIAGAAGQGRPDRGLPAGTADKWSVFTEGAFLYQFDSGIDSGGSFGASRLLFEGFTYAPDFRRSVSIAVGYDRTAYDCEDNPALRQRHPGERSTPSA